MNIAIKYNIVSNSIVDGGVFVFWSAVSCGGYFKGLRRNQSVPRGPIFHTSGGVIDVYL